MRKIALDAASKAQGVNAEFLHAHAPENTVSTILDLKGAHGEYGVRNNLNGNFERFDVSDSQSRPSLLKSAKYCTINELVKNNVVSSRIRLARNVAGLEFPRNIKTTDQRVVDLMNGAYAAAQGVFEARLLPMNKLKKSRKSTYRAAFNFSCSCKQHAKRRGNRRGRQKIRYIRDDKRGRPHKGAVRRRRIQP